MVYKYKYSNAEVKASDGNVYKICDICGERCKSNMGVEISYSTTRVSGGLRKGYCRKCASKYAKLISEFVDKLSDKGGVE